MHPLWSSQSGIWENKGFQKRRRRSLPSSPTAQSDLDQDAGSKELNASPSNSSALFHSYLKLTIDEMNEKYPLINWTLFFGYIYEAASITQRQSMAANQTTAHLSEVLIHNSEFMQELMELLGRYTSSKSRLKILDNYLCWALVARFLPYLGPNFRRLYADFRTKVPDIATDSVSDPSGGAGRVFLSRWKECVHVSGEGLDVPASLLYLKHKAQFLEVSHRLNAVKRGQS